MIQLLKCNVQITLLCDERKKDMENLMFPNLSLVFRVIQS